MLATVAAMRRFTPSILILQGLALGILVCLPAPRVHAQQSEKLAADASLPAAPAPESCCLSDPGPASGTTAAVPRGLDDTAVAVPLKPRDPAAASTPPGTLPTAANFTPGRIAPRVKLTPRKRQAWIALALVEHGAAFFDAYTTREAIGKGYREGNPLFAPFARSAAIYPAMQITHLGVDWLALRLATSRHSWVRRLWWLPQTAATAGSVWAGVHNLSLPSHPGSRLR